MKILHGIVKIFRKKSGLVYVDSVKVFAKQLFSFI